MKTSQKSKTLIITEKPSVADDIAKVLGGFTKQKDYFESDRYIIAAAAGHLLEMDAPDEPKLYPLVSNLIFKVMDQLPYMPPSFRLQPIGKGDRLVVLKKLVRRPDVTALINACDAGREGELIFRRIVEYTGAEQPIKRLWLQSMTPKAIKEGFQNLKSDKEMKSLAQAARCRAEADWLVGINATRAISCLAAIGNNFSKLNIGRVKTPTLAMVVEREKLINNFVPSNYWEVCASFRCAGGVYEGRWVDPESDADKSDQGMHIGRLHNLKDAEAIVADCRGKICVVTETSDLTKQKAPPLFDLTSLQREANKRFGFSAKKTLEIAQRLYDQHKALTYPRTDSNRLPEDYLDVCAETVMVLSNRSNFASFAKQILSNRWIKPNKNIFDNEGISDHFAIIPTGQPLGNAEEDDCRIYDLVVRRFLSVFYPPAEFEVITRSTKIGKHCFLSRERFTVNPGWMTVRSKSSQLQNKNSRGLAPIVDGERVLAQSIWVDTLMTKPPVRYSEATLLSAMEGAGALVDVTEFTAAMKGKGIGTPATRANIIEELFDGYLKRQGREIIPTARAFMLMDLLKDLKVEKLISPSLTGEWEYKLNQVADGKFAADEFMKQTKALVDEIVGLVIDEKSSVELHVPCPECGGKMHAGGKKFSCCKCGFSIPRIRCGRLFSVAEIEDLVAGQKIGPFNNFFSVRTGRMFSGEIQLTNENGRRRLKYVFPESTPVDVSDLPVVGTCPQCWGTVFAGDKAYICEHAMPGDKVCQFRMSKVRCKREIELDQMRKILSDGKSDLLEGFISKRGKPFSAYLILNDSDEIGFEFIKK